jgi:hypothetical protein
MCFCRLLPSYIVGTSAYRTIEKCTCNMNVKAQKKKKKKKSAEGIEAQGGRRGKHARVDKH